MKFLESSNQLLLLILATGVIATDAFVPSSSMTFRRSYSSTSSYKPTILHMGNNLEPLAKEGPWTAYLDDATTGLVYYFNIDTGESSWDPPTATFPQVKMTKRKEEQMLAKRKDYNVNRVGFEEATQMDTSSVNGNGEVSEGGKKGIFGNLFAPKTKVEPVVLEQVEEEIVEEEPVILEDTPKPNWFDGFLGGRKAKKNNVEDETEVKFEDAVPVIEEEEYYDQSLFEDAVLVVDDKVDNGKGNKSFASDIMNFASFPATGKKVEQEVAEVIPKVLKIDFGSKILPHPEKVSWGGEDAIFVSGKTFGVFDGVSGAEKLEGVPLYSNTLAQQLKSEAGKESLSVEDIKGKLLSAAEYADVSATGASTAVMASIGDDDIMRALCLGDSVLMVIRNGSVFSKTKESTHYFDCPYQLSEDSPDRPRDGTILTTKLLVGDTIVTGSDGVFDNLEPDDIIRIVTDEKMKSKPALIAQKIVAESRRVSLDTEAPTPYAKQAKRNRYESYASGLGGKVDDISCIVVNIS